MPHWMLEDAIHHAWKRLKGLPLPIDSPAAGILPAVLSSLVELNHMSKGAVPSDIEKYVRETLAARIMMLDVVDDAKTAETVADVLDSFRDAGFSI